MIKKGTKLYAIFNNVCPRCHEGKFFKYPISLTPSKMSELNKTCSECHLKYMIEPSFFYGAMYVNYAITVALSVAIFLITYLLGASLKISFAAIIIALIVLIPVNLRLARTLWISMFIHYDEHAIEKAAKKNA